MDVEINDLATLGVINDVPAYQLPPEAFSLGLNIRYSNQGIEALTGYEQIFGTPAAAPHFMMPIITASQNFWIYASLTDLFVYDGTTHTNISKSAAAYSAASTSVLNGVDFSGIPIVNNGTDVPQFRANMLLATKFADLTNWPGALRAAVIRAYGPYLIALNLVDGGVALPHTVQWSHPASPGAVPSSWDYTNPAVDAGRQDLRDASSGLIRDGLPLAKRFVVYKDNSTYVLALSGKARFPFTFDTLFETSGILAPRCVTLTGDGTRHVVLTQDDLIWHNGASVDSILFERQRAALFAEMDSANYKNSFVFCLPLRNEIWVCYPTSGQVNPNKALIWNYKVAQKGSISFADGITFRNAAIGNIEGATDELWSDGTDSWDEDTGGWSELSRRRVVLAGTDATKFYNMDRTNTRDGVAFTSTLQRVNLAISGKKRTGEPIEDWTKVKLWHKMLPKIVGGPVNIRAGKQDVVNGPIAWGSYEVFDSSLGRWVELNEVSGVSLSWDMNSSGVAWRLDGYVLNFDVIAGF